ncbi:hypothetical protein ElyMa_005496600 [Elysia marginata]|uniref:Peptidase A2 domain-containing protein n=1 Tax=Elysia marginata TaxID=1093978 RepID=A0AAV4EU37_9GAST|nr:hypothetical protein ElyMa_005496600 [Elysia marginata]
MVGLLRVKELTTHYKSAYPDRPIGKDAIVANTATFTKKVKEQPTDVRPSVRPTTRGYQQPFPLAQRRRAYSTEPNWQYRNDRQNEYQGPRSYGSNQPFNQYGQYRYNEGNFWHMNPRGRGQISRDRFRRGGRSLTYRGDDQKGRNPQNNKFANVAQDRAVLTALSARIHEKPGLKLRTGRVNGKTFTAMFDSGCNTIGVHQRLLKESDYSGKTETCVLFGGMRQKFETAVIQVESPWYTGQATAFVMPDSIAELIVGDFEGVDSPLKQIDEPANERDDPSNDSTRCGLVAARSSPRRVKQRKVTRRKIFLMLVPRKVKMKELPQIRV